MKWLRVDKIVKEIEIAHYEKGLIAIFEQFFASIKKILILAGRLGTRL